MACIASLSQAVPQFHHTQPGVPAPHIPDQLELRFCMLVGMMVWPPGLWAQRFDAPIPPFEPEVDVR